MIYIIIYLIGMVVTFFLTARYRASREERGLEWGSEDYALTYLSVLLWPLPAPFWIFFSFKDFLEYIHLSASKLFISKRNNETLKPFELYLRKLLDLHRLTEAEEKNSEEIDKILEEMDDCWYQLTEQEMQLVELVSAAL